MEYEEYQQRLKELCIRTKKSFGIKPGFISALVTRRYINKIVKLNKETDNRYIAELRYVLGRTKLEYKKYCKQNNYYPDVVVSRKIREAYIKLSKKSLKLQTKQSNIDMLKEKVDIEYNSDRGSYVFRKVEDGQIKYSKEYRINNVKNLEAKRRHAIERLRRINFGINIFDELEISEKKLYKINPDIVHILINEGKIDYAKLYIKEVVGGESINNPLKIKYMLNRDNKKGKFSREENRAMKKMARLDGLANELVIFNDKKKKVIQKPKSNMIDYLKPYINSFKRVFNKPQPVSAPAITVSNISYNYDIVRADKISDIKAKIRRQNIKRTVFNPACRNTNTGKVVARGAVNNNAFNIERRAKRNMALEER